MLWSITIKLDILSLSAAGRLVITQLQHCMFLCTRDFIDFLKSFFTFQCFVVTVPNVWLGGAVIIPENTIFCLPQTKLEMPKYLLYAAN